MVPALRRTPAPCLLRRGTRISWFGRSRLTDSLPLALPVLLLLVGDVQNTASWAEPGWCDYSGPFHTIPAELPSPSEEKVAGGGGGEDGGTVSGAGGGPSSEGGRRQRRANKR